MQFVSSGFHFMSKQGKNLQSHNHDEEANYLIKTECRITQEGDSMGLEYATQPEQLSASL